MHRTICTCASTHAYACTHMQHKGPHERSSLATARRFQLAYCLRLHALKYTACGVARVLLQGHCPPVPARTLMTCPCTHTRSMWRCASAPPGPPHSSGSNLCSHMASKQGWRACQACPQRPCPWICRPLRRLQPQVRGLGDRVTDPGGHPQSCRCHRTGRVPET